MPPRKIPNSLFDIASKTFINCLVGEWHKNIGRQWSAELATVPITVFNSLVTKIIDLMGDLGPGSIFEDIPLAFIFPNIMLEHLTYLDLSPLTAFDHHTDHSISDFKVAFMDAIPSLNNLIFLSLKTDPHSVTLPVCDNYILHGIGKYCHVLKYLNLANNTEVSDEGLTYLIPCADHKGCPELDELIVYDCSLSAHGVAYVLQGLPGIRNIGFREMGHVLTVFYRNLRKNKKDNIPGKLNLLSIKNVGSGSRTCENLSMLRFNKQMALTISVLCPNVKKLHARVMDEDVVGLVDFPTVSKLCLIYNFKIPLSPGETTRYYFTLHGAKLTSLTLVCNVFCSEYFSFLGSACPSLTELCVRSNHFEHDLNFEDRHERNLKVFPVLSIFALRVGISEICICEIPIDLLCFILRTSNCLTQLRFLFRSMTLTDEAIRYLWSCINTQCLQTVSIKIPHLNRSHHLIPLTIASAYFILNESHSIEKLDNLRTWNISGYDLHSLRNFYRSHNYDVEIISKTEVVK